MKPDAMLPKMETIGKLLVALSLLYAALGFSTYSYKSANAHIIELKEKSLPNERYGGRSPLLNLSPDMPPDIRTFYEVTYSYQFEGGIYTSSFIGFYFPTSDTHNSFTMHNGSVTAYVCPYFPMLSVLVTGFQIFLVLPFLVVGFLMARYLKPLPRRAA